MPYQFTRIIGETRQDCANPEQNSPTDDLILQRVGDVSQQLQNQAQNSSFSWDVGYVDLDVQADKGEYLIPDTKRGGKVQWIHTIQPADRFHVNRPVPVIERQHQPEIYQGPATGLNGNFSSSQHSAVAMIVYYTSGSLNIEVVPKPQAACTYRIWFESGEIPEPLLNGKVSNLVPFHRFVRLKTSYLVLPYCEWGGLSRSEAREYRAELRGPMEPFLLQWERDYANYISTSHQAGYESGGGFVSDDYLGGDG